MGTVPENRVAGRNGCRLGGTSRMGVLFPHLVLLCASLTLTGCDQVGSTSTPVEGPEIVVERFYTYISEAKLRGGGSSPAREAFKLISAEHSHLRVEQFLEVIKTYPPGFRVEIGEVEISGSHALASISYQMPSMFSDGYTMTTEVPLTIDQTTNTWKVDFTGETDGMDKNVAMKNLKAGQLEVVEEGSTKRDAE
ncbi:MAG: hypothetical protein GY721_10665 [Deltaproteobacteria bacterium]|nr:hypothetical protein [Deltaproteobacteria bacterium]